MSPPVIRIRSSATCSASRVAPYHTVVIHVSPSFCNRSRLSRSTGVPYPTHARGSTCNPYTDFCGMQSHRTWHVIYCGMRPPSFSYPYLWLKLSILKSIFGHGLPACSHLASRMTPYSRYCSSGHPQKIDLAGKTSFLYAVGITC